MKMGKRDMRLIVYAVVCTVSSAGLAAEWIAGSYRPPSESDGPAFFAPARNDVVERAFRTRDVEVSSATWRVAAPGMRDLFVNGERVSSTALPPLTPYRKRILEEAFDVTAQVRRGAENALRIELGNGWYNLLPLKMWYAYNLREHMATGTPCVKATLEIAYADGVREKVATDASWRAAKGRLVHNSIYLGVVEDRRLAVDFAENARVVEGPSGRVVDAGAFPKVVVYDKWKARSVTQISNGVWLVDMGVNAAGTLRVRLRGVPRGEKVRLRQGERIWPDGTVNVMTAVAGQIKNPAKGPLFAVAEQRDSVIGDGSQEFVFEPRMAFHVFRYVQVEGPCAAPRPEDFEICAWSADVRERSHFTCSNERLNNLHEVCRRTFRSNLQGVQSDCPGREKFGYGGDIACTLDAFWSNYDMADFYRKTLRDFLDEAEDDGLFTETAPFVGIASRSVYPADGQTPNSMLAERGTRAAPIGWAVGVPVIVDSLVRYDGDLDSVRLAYPALVRFIDLVARRYPSNDIPECLGDWIAIEPEKANCGLSGLAHWHQFVSLTAKFARLLGKADDAERLANLAERIAAKFRADYVHENGRVGSGFQGEQLFALYHGLFEPKDVPAAYELLKKDIRAHGDALTTGIFATKYMLEYLPLHGDAALAARVAMHEGFPGWFHMVDRGATTLWENWSEEKSVNVHSNCHPMFGSVDEWLIRHVLGISVCEDAVGCDKVRIAPQPIPGVASASGWFDTPKGRIAVSWRIVDGKLDVKSDVPSGIKVVPPPTAGRLAIAERGHEPGCTIVLPEAPSPSQEFAAAELRKYICEMTGVALPIATNEAPARGIFLGNGSQDLGNDGFRLVAAPPHFRIEGNGVHGTLFGVYDFLERYCGCEWLSPNCEVVPQREKVEVSATLDDVQRPAFPLRDLNWTDHLRNPGFSAKLKVNGFRIEYPEGLGGRDHAKDTTTGGAIFDSLCPPSKYFKSHPEWFSLIDGKRTALNSQRCLTNKGFLDFLVNQTMERIRKNYPRRKYYSIYQNDQKRNCQCADCTALDEREGSPSATMVHMANYVAERVAKAYPDVTILTFAYMYTLKPPKTMKVHPNVMICYCADACDFSKPIRESRWKGCQAFVENFKKWKEIANKIYIWDYSANFKYLFQPFECCHVMPANFRYFWEMGVFGVFEEGDHYGVKCVDEALKTWVIGHLLWNPDQPLEPLLDRFFRGYYGAAAGVARGYYDALVKQEMARDESKEPLVMWGTKRDDPFQPLEFFDEWSAKWTAALELVRDDPIRRENVYWARHNVDLVRLVRSKLGAKYSLATRVDAGMEARRAVLMPVAKRVLADFARVKGLNKFRDNSMVRGRVEAIALFDLSNADKCGDRVVIPVADMLVPDKTATKRVDDPLAAGGKAIRMGSSAPGGMHHCLAFREESLTMDHGAKIGIRVHARVEGKGAAKGSVFSVGTCDLVTYSKRDIRNFHVGADKVAGDGYAWYDIDGTWTPAGSETVWIGNGKLVDGENPCIKAVYFDQIELYRK